ncbi:MAG: sugar phosphate isomerase/epimerase [Lentisphaerae bacterium]|nr:sugar phosphate isomerase/epimerase [Lentisphaerota bacterium]
MRKGIYLSFLPGESPEEKFCKAAELGFSCVEVPTLETDAERKRYRQAASAAGVSIPSVMNSRHWASPLSDPDPAVRRLSREGVLHSLATATELGADTVLLVPAVVKPDVTYEQAWERSVAEIEILLPAFASKKVCLTIENVGNKFLLSPLEMTAYIDYFDSPFLGAYFDVGNICLYGYPQHWILRLGKRLKKVHIKGFDTRTRAFTSSLLGGDIDWKAVCQALRKVGYDDVLTAELAGEGETPLDKARNISSEMDRILEYF